MSGVAVAALLVVLAVGCADSPRSSLPTAPTATEPAGTAGGGGRTEEWQLALTVREVFGIECDDPALDHPRMVPLEVEFERDGTVTLRYGHSAHPFGDAAAVNGWTLEGGFEGTGYAYEGLPCSGAAVESFGAPTMLTGYFADDGRSFTGVEVRRYIDRPAGEIVYHLEWRAER